MNRRSGLGRGITSLIPLADTAAEDGAVTTLAEIAVADITPNPHQPRVHFDEESLAELAASIEQLGVLQPILVRPVDDGYQLIAASGAGERRSAPGSPRCRRSSGARTTSAPSNRPSSRTSIATTSRRSKRRPPSSN
jgi:hypothetical protein